MSTRKNALAVEIVYLLALMRVIRMNLIASLIRGVMPIYTSSRLYRELP